MKIIRAWANNNKLTINFDFLAFDKHMEKFILYEGLVKTNPSKVDKAYKMEGEKGCLPS